MSKYPPRLTRDSELPGESPRQLGTKRMRSPRSIQRRDLAAGWAYVMDFEGDELTEAWNAKTTA
jgi:hypothetical protein